MTSSAGVLTKLQVPASLRQTWLDALRDPQFQGREAYSTLHATKDGQDHFCAIGLAAYVSGVDESLSSTDVYKWFMDDQGIDPQVVYEVFDGQVMTFTQFADWLEANSEAVE